MEKFVHSIDSLARFMQLKVLIEKPAFNGWDTVRRRAYTAYEQRVYFLHIYN